MDNKKQEKLGEFVSREVVICQSMLISELLRQEVLSWEDIKNNYADLDNNEIKDATDEIMEGDKDLSRDEARTQAIDNLKDEKEPQEIFEWWVVSGWLLGRLEAKGEPVLRTDLGDWWGRTTTGQAIQLDGVIERIYDDMTSR